MPIESSVEVLNLSASDLLLAFRRKDLSPVDVARLVLDRIETTQSNVNAFSLIDRATTLRLAEESERRWLKGSPIGLIDGIPVSIKDNLRVCGWPTLEGSRAINRDQVWDDDSPCASRVRENGGVFIGKTNLPEFCHKLVTDNPLTGITRNPWDLTKSSGGSSGGAAAALAIGAGPLAIGSDGGASIRVPAAWSGVFGIKPSFGRVPAYPTGNYAPLSCVGPMARTTEDAALLLTVISQGDVRDWAAAPPNGVDYRIGLELGVEGMCIAWSSSLGFVDVEIDPQCLELARRAVSVLASHGARIEEVDPPISNPQSEYRKIWRLLTAHALRRFSPEEQALMDPAFVELGSNPGAVSLLELHDAMDLCGVLGTQMGLFHTRYDLLLSMTTPGTAVGVNTPLMETVRNSALTRPFNMTGQPAASVPIGVTTEGLPVGLQIVGAIGDEARVFRAAQVIERALGVSKAAVPAGSC